MSKGVEGGVNALRSGGHMEESWHDVPALVLLSRAATGRFWIAQGHEEHHGTTATAALRSSLSHHCQMCSQLRAQRRRYPLRAARW